MLDGCIVGTAWERLSVLRDTQGLRGNSALECKSGDRYLKLALPRVLHLALWLVMHQVPGGYKWWRLGRFVFGNLQNKLNEAIAGTQVYISLRLTSTSIQLTSCIKHTTSVLIYHEITWLEQNNASHSNTQPMTYTALYVPSRLSSATCNCIIMLMPQT